MKAIQRILLLFFHLAEWCLIAAAGVLVILMLFGIHPYAVKTGSMEPTITIGSVCFVNQRTTFEEIHEGDIIVFSVNEMIVTHRAVCVNQEGITTKGDANNIEDAIKITRESYIGKTIFWLPYLGRFFLLLQTKEGKIIGIAVIFLFAAIIIYENRMSKELSRMEENAGHSA